MSRHSRTATMTADILETLREQWFWGFHTEAGKDDQFVVSSPSLGRFRITVTEEVEDG